ncbi:hypothetical protein Vadar_018912 [Vaccinium darrowii]|uniref:Uncharacterized protein n=1 Tax=Vaccinium darrowii TaxID=229202 RepID=A0ACB7YF02_9ERIC|nr:hypothetical protein Vadar_018912 [Vaccinium darrowii]
MVKKSFSNLLKNQQVRKINGHLDFQGLPLVFKYMESSQVFGNAEECNSSESGWTMYIGSPITNDDHSDDGDKDDDGDHEHDVKHDEDDHDSDDSMASDASSGPSHRRNSWGNVKDEGKKNCSIKKAKDPVEKNGYEGKKKEKEEDESVFAAKKASVGVQSSEKPQPHLNFYPHGNLLIRTFNSSVEKEKEPKSSETKTNEDYPSGEYEFKEVGGWKKFVVKLRTLIAFPWERIPNGSVLTMKLRGQISDELKSPFAPGLSLPQICENFLKAAYDPRISGIYLHIEPLKCGWGKLEEIRRHMLDFKKSGKFLVGYAPAFGEKEYYLACACEELYAPPSAYFSLYGLVVQAAFLGGVLEKVGIDPQVQKVGKYKSMGDQLACKKMTEETCEMLTSLLDNIHGNWLDKISVTTGKKREDIENFINEGVYQLERLKETGLITNIKYDDEVMSKLKERLGIQKEKNLPAVDYWRYSRVREWTVGLSGGKDLIAVLRASGRISRARGPFNIPSTSIISEQFIEKIRRLRESKRFKAVVIRIDSPGGDALASDLIWREIRLLAASKPVIASMADVAASGGYYMAMAAGVIVAENLTLTGSIGVVTGKPNLGKLYEKIGFNKEVISRGRFAELKAAEQRPLRPDEAELLARSAQSAYKRFRDKAAFSRSMPVEKMEEVAQGRVWTGKDAVSRGLVDAIGGFSRAVAIAKHKANIPQDREVTLVELSRPSPTLPEISRGIGNTLVEVDRTLKDLLEELVSSDGIQARMDGILFQKLEGASYDASLLSNLIKDYEI